MDTDKNGPWAVISVGGSRDEVLVDATTLIKGDMKVMTGNRHGATWAGPQYPNTTSPGHWVYDAVRACSPACLYNVTADPEERVDLAADPAQQELLTQLLKRKEELSATIWEGATKPGSPDPACRTNAKAMWGGFLGPWQEVDLDVLV